MICGINEADLFLKIKAGSGSVFWENALDIYRLHIAGLNKAEIIRFLVENDKYTIPVSMKSSKIGLHGFLQRNIKKLQALEAMRLEEQKNKPEVPVSVVAEASRIVQAPAEVVRVSPSVKVEEVVSVPLPQKVEEVVVETDIHRVEIIEKEEDAKVRADEHEREGGGTPSSLDQAAATKRGASALGLATKKGAAPLPPGSVMEALLNRNINHNIELHKRVQERENEE